VLGVGDGAAANLEALSDRSAFALQAVEGVLQHCMRNLRPPVVRS
jgi:hypothetical protein